MPGVNPASATPSNRRAELNDHLSKTNPVPSAITPQAMVIEPNQRRAPIRWKAMLAGMPHSA